MGRRLLVFLALASLLLACSCLSELGVDPFEPGDLRPPSLLSWDAPEPRAFILRFDEAVSALPDTFALDPPLLVQAIESDGAGLLVLRLATDQVPGAEYALAGMAEDAAGNSVRFVLPFSGYNPALPDLLLNELLTEASSTHLDAIELRMLSSGDLAGIVVGSGQPSNPTWAWRLGSVEVQAGDLIALHLRPQGLPVEMDEPGASDVSGGLDAEPTARDFWYRGADGALPGANGVVWVRRSATGPLMDAVFYCERTSLSDERYSGFGTQALKDAVGELVAAEAWTAAEALPRPEDGVPSGAVTATRTLCRASATEDSDSRDDWYVAATGGEGLGLPNTAPAYVP